jgi:hypothetical protein
VVLLDKKGMYMEQIVKAIVVLAIIAIFGYFFVRFVVLGEESSDREACRTSVLVKAKLKVLGKPLLTELNCKTDFKEIKTDDLDEIRMEITKEMYDCWYEFGEGKVDFVTDWVGDKYVFVCSRLDFDPRIRESVDKVSGFFEFWTSKELPFRGDMTFYEYFYGNNEKPESADLEVSTSEPVYVVFVGLKRNRQADLARVLFGIDSISEEIGLGIILGGVSEGGSLGPIWAKALLASRFYKGDLVPFLLVGNAEDILPVLTGAGECVPGIKKECGISGLKGDCAKGEKVCLSSYRWSECEQVVFPEGENCLQGSGDEDCDGLENGKDPDCDWKACSSVAGSSYYCWVNGICAQVSPPLNVISDFIRGDIDLDGVCLASRESGPQL